MSTFKLCLLYLEIADRSDVNDGGVGRGQSNRWIEFITCRHYEGYNLLTHTGGDGRLADTNVATNTNRESFGSCINDDDYEIANKYSFEV